MATINAALGTPLGEPGDFFSVGNEDLSAMRVYLRYKLFRALDNLALKDTSSAKAGLLLGKHSVSPSSEAGWIKVDEAVEVADLDGSYPESVWESARQSAAQSYPGLEVVGWFHSHPDAGIGLQPVDVEVHSRSFREPYQVVYVMDPLLRERGFHIWQNGKICYATGFRIYGKEEKVMTNMAAAAEHESPRPDEHLRERYLERSVEKLQKMVRRPAIRPIDYAIVGLQILIIALFLLRPNPVAKVDQTDILAGQDKIAQDVAQLSLRMQKQEEHLKALGVLDEELKLPAASAENSAPVSAEHSEVKGSAPEVTASVPKVKDASPVAAAATAPEASATPREIVAGVAVGSKVRLHKVDSGETLSLIAEKYYQSSDAGLLKALGKYNRLKPPYFDIYQGDTLKIPERSSLGR